MSSTDDLRQSAVEARLAQLEDTLAIQELKFRYNAACDFGFDGDAIADCFTPDGRWVANTYADCHGRDEIKEFFRRLSRITSQSLHYATSPRIEIDPTGNRAVGRFNLLCLSTVKQRGVDAFDAMVILGSYVDTFVKVEGHWLIEEMRADIRSTSEWTQGWVNQPWRP